MRSKTIFCLVTLVGLFRLASAATISDSKALTSSFKARLAHARLYRAPEFPEGCLDWTMSPKGSDSVWMFPKVASTKACRGVHVDDRWILSRSGGEPFLVSGPHDEERTELSMLTSVPDEETGSDAAPDEAPVESVKGDDDENVVDAILAGGGGSLKKAPRHESRDDGTVTSQGGIGTGSRTGWGTGNASAHSQPTGAAAVHLRFDDPDTSDIQRNEKSGRSKESLRRVARANLGSLRFTLEKYLKTNPDLLPDPFQLTLTLTIAGTGNVVTAIITRSGEVNTPLDEELQNKAKFMRFDPLNPSAPSETMVLRLRGHRK